VTDDTRGGEPTPPIHNEGAEAEAEPPAPAATSNVRPIVLSAIASALVSLLAAVGLQSLLNNNPPVAICVLALLIAFLVGAIAFVQAPVGRVGAALASLVCVVFLLLGVLSFWKVTEDVHIEVVAGPQYLVSQKLAPLAVDIGPNRRLEDATWGTSVAGMMRGNVLDIDASTLNEFYRNQMKANQATAAQTVKNCVEGGGPG